MLLRLIILLTIVPVIEISLILRVHGWVQIHSGSAMAMLVSVGTIIFTGIIGANLAKREGLQVLQKIQQASAQGQMPAAAMVDGLMIFVGGALLLTPGYLTDSFGFTLLFPLTRTFYRRLFTGWIQRQIKNGSMQMNFHGQGAQFGGAQWQNYSEQELSHKGSSEDQSDDVIDIEAIDYSSDK